MERDLNAAVKACDWRLRLYRVLGWLDEPITLTIVGFGLGACALPFVAEHDTRVSLLFATIVGCFLLGVLCSAIRAWMGDWVVPDAVLAQLAQCSVSKEALVCVRRALKEDGHLKLSGLVHFLWVEEGARLERRREAEVAASVAKPGASALIARGGDE